jgi:hypothetical protein
MKIHGDAKYGNCLKLHQTATIWFAAYAATTFGFASAAFGCNPGWRYDPKYSSQPPTIVQGTVQEVVTTDGGTTVSVRVSSASGPDAATIGSLIKVIWPSARDCATPRAPAKIDDDFGENIDPHMDTGYWRISDVIRRFVR